MATAILSNALAHILSDCLADLFTPTLQKIFIFVIITPHVFHLSKHYGLRVAPFHKEPAPSRKQRTV